MREMREERSTHLDVFDVRHVLSVPHLRFPHVRVDVVHRDTQRLLRAALKMELRGKGAKQRRVRRMRGSEGEKCVSGRSRVWSGEERCSRRREACTHPAIDDKRRAVHVHGARRAGGLGRNFLNPTKHSYRPFPLLRVPLPSPLKQACFANVFPSTHLDPKGLRHRHDLLLLHDLLSQGRCLHASRQPRAGRRLVRRDRRGELHVREARLHGDLLRQGL